MSAIEIDRVEELAIMTLNRPDRLNTLDLDAAALLRDRLQELAHDRSIFAVVITGTGRAFCAGGDLVWARSHAAGLPMAFHVLAGCFHQSIVEIRQMGKPVIAAVNGIAAGAGFSLALACDFRVMDRTAALRQAYTSAGLSVDGGGTFVLPRLVGFARALEIAAFDEPLDAERSLSLGLATRVVDQGQAAAEARVLAQDLAGRSLTSFAWSKRLLNRAFDSPLEVQLEAERRGIVDCAASPEGKEGLKAFSDKRPANFRLARRTTDQGRAS